MSEILKHGALILSTDASAFQAESDTALRMKEYATLYGAVHVLVCARDIRRDDTEVVPNVYAYSCRYGNKIWGLFSALRKTKELSARIRPEVIIAQDAFMFGLIALLAARSKQIPVIVGIYGTDIHNAFVRTESLKHRFYAMVARRVLKYADAIQTDGPETVERLQKEYGAKVFFKPMFPANMGALRQVRRSASGAPFRVLFVGRFVPQKNIPLLLDVMEETARRNGNIVFSIVGDGPQKPWFMEEAAGRGIIGTIEDKGVLSRAEILDAYATHHVLLLTSRYEGFPRVFMEAAVTGLPVVTTEVGGTTGLIENNVTGIVVPQGTPAKEIAEKVVGLAKNPEELSLMSTAIKARWEKRYGNKTILDYQRPIAEFISAVGRNKKGA